jgi:hypothetical protein
MSVDSKGRRKSAQFDVVIGGHGLLEEFGVYIFRRTAPFCPGLCCDRL